MKRAIVIDDVENARASLIQDLSDYCEDIEIVGQGEGVISGAKAIKELKPDIVFLDIHMKDGTGFDLLEIIGEIDFALIFTTSSNEHALQAFRFSAIDYLLKPIDPEELMEAVKKAEKKPEDNFSLLKSNLNDKEFRLALNSQDKIRVVDLPNVVRLESSGSYTLFCLEDGEQVLVTKTLKEYDQLLSNFGFLRAHQSHLINLKFVKEFIKTDGGYLVLKSGDNIPVASRKKSSVMKALSSIS